LLLRFAPATEALTLEGNRPESGDRHALKPGANETIQRVVGHNVSLGPATIQRELVRVGAVPNVRYAFRERITAQV
jgi:hypothetical protein